MDSTLTGGCLCGAIRYTITAPVKTLRACHCVNCQKASGGGGTVNTLVPTHSFRITRGTPKRYDDSATRSGRTLGRHFCADCGSPLYSQRHPDPGFVVVRAGTLDDSSGLRIGTHIWTSAARPWDLIDPATERYDENPPPPPTR